MNNKPIFTKESYILDYIRCLATILQAQLLTLGLDGAVTVRGPKLSVSMTYNILFIIYFHVTNTSG